MMDFKPTRIPPSRRPFRTCLFLALLLFAQWAVSPTASAAEPEPADSDRFADLAWLVGTWQAEFLPPGVETAPTMLFDWGPDRSYLRMLGYRPVQEGGLVPEHETRIVWNPVDERFEILGHYHGSGTSLLEKGWLETLEGGGLRLHMVLLYEEGARLPFSDGAVAGAGGHVLNFRRTLRPDGANGIRGTFFLQRGGRWENPHPEIGLDFYPWKRVDGGGGEGMPGWAREHLAALTRGSGRWVASNARYASESETADAYGLEWEWAIGRQGVKGRLFGLRDGEEIGTYWELRTFWHPAERRLVAEQFGAGGRFGHGTIRPTGDREVEVEQTFYAADGSASRLLHRSTDRGTSKVDRSFDWQDGAWQPRRQYTWELATDGVD